MYTIHKHTGRLAVLGAAMGFLVAGVAAAPPASGTAVGLDRFEHQVINWHGCQVGADDPIGARIDAHGGQCGEVSVPLDYGRPGGPTITLAVSRIRAKDPAHRRGVLFTNGGGPGEPSIDIPINFTFEPDVIARYDVIGMDPRFVGRSAPVQCDWSTDTFLRAAGPDRHTFQQSVDFARTLAAGCVAGNERVLPYATTRNTARDMDVIRAALGESTISYESGSYGSYLGAVYVQMFGNRVDRFVLDSSPDPTLFGGTALTTDGPAAAAALSQWAGWAAARNATYGLGATAGDVLAIVDRVRRAAERGPLRVGAFQVDSHTVPYLLWQFNAEDDDDSRANTADVVRTLRVAADGGAATPSPVFNEFLTNLFTGSGDAADRAGLPILCADRAVSHNPADYFRDIQAHRATEPLFGPFIRNITPCAFWPFRPVEPPTTIHNDVPVLMVANQGDPVTPYTGQLVLHRALRGSRLVTQPGAFRHQAYQNNSACVDAAVNRYLVDGVRPAADTVCAA